MENQFEEMLTFIEAAEKKPEIMENAVFEKLMVDVIANLSSSYRIRFSRLKLFSDDGNVSLSDIPF